MYVPASFRVNDSVKQADFMRQHSFATLVTHDGEAPFASHLPILFEPDGEHGTLIAHMARANPQWQQFGEGEVLAIFAGPHAYISPAWYQTRTAVPTWNYAAVHAYGLPQIITDDAQLCSLLETMVDTYEQPLGRPWDGSLPDDVRDSLIQQIVGFEITITRIEAKFKLSQNRPPADRQGVFDILSQCDDDTSQSLARLMQTECDVRPNGTS